MALDFLILFVLAFGLWWLSGRLIDDVLDQVDAQWSRWRAHEEIGTSCHCWGPHQGPSAPAAEHAEWCPVRQRSRA